MDDLKKCQVCGNYLNSLTKKSIDIFSNILLNNYSKLKNDTSGNATKKRKVQKFVQSK